MADALRKVEVLDKRLAVNNTRKYAVLRGPEDFIWQTYNSSSFSNSNATVQHDPPQEQLIVCPTAYLQTTFTVTINGTASVTPDMLSVNLQGNINAYDGPRAKALWKVINTLKCGIGNENFTTNLNEYAEIYDRFCNMYNEGDWSDYSGQPNMPDYDQSYSLTDHSNRDPFATYADNPLWNTRASFPMTIISNTPTQAVVQITLSAPIPLSPWAFGGQERSGFYDVDKASTYIVWGDLSRLWSHSPAGNTVTSISVDVNSVSTRLGFLTPPETISRRMNHMQDLPYYDVDLYTTNISPALAPGQSTVVQMNAVQLPNYPNKGYFYARRQDDDLTYETSDCYANISAISISMAGKSSLLASLSELDLYNISVKNGYNGSFQEWHQRWGSVLCLLFGEDIPLQPNADTKAPGLNEKITYQMKVTITNIHPTDTITFQFNAVFVEEGICTIRDKVVRGSVGTLTKEDIMMAEPSNLTFSAAHNVLGGFSWSGLFNKVASIASNPTVQQLAKMGAAKGMEYLSRGQGVLARGKGVVGGRMLRRSQLLR